MPEDDDNRRDDRVHYEGGVPVFETQLERIEREQAEARERDKLYRDEQLRINRQQLRVNTRYMIFTFFLVITSMVTGGISLYQASIAKTSARAAESAAKTASATLKEIQTGQGAQDTHILASQAVTQATQTTSLASAAERQATLTKEGLLDVQRAFVSVSALDIYPIKRSTGEVDRWIVNPIVVNSGTTPTKNLYWIIGFGNPVIASGPIDKEPPLDPPDYPSLSDLMHHKNMKRGTISPQVSIRNFTTLIGFTPDRLHTTWIVTGQFVYGAFVYGDVIDPIPRHVTEFCFMFNSTALVDDQFLPPYERCAHHNCTDGACREN